MFHALRERKKEKLSFATLWELNHNCHGTQKSLQEQKAGWKEEGKNISCLLFNLNVDNNFLFKSLFKSAIPEIWLSGNLDFSKSPPKDLWLCRF